MKHSAAFPEAAETLRLVIGSFRATAYARAGIGSRSRIEDGQFVGWLSYPNVVEAEAGFQALHDALARSRPEGQPADSRRADSHGVAESLIQVPWTGLSRIDRHGRSSDAAGI